MALTGALSLGSHPTPDVHVTDPGKATLRRGDLLCVPDVKIPKLLERDTGRKPRGEATVTYLKIKSAQALKLVLGLMTLWAT